MRLQLVLSHSGCASRRRSAAIIKEGAVRVNGLVVTEPGKRIDLSKDVITYRGKRLILEKEKVYIVLNKPKGIITTASDTHGRSTAFSLLPKVKCRLHYVGRLDKDTSGLLLFTNDGEMTHRLTHPSFRIERRYDVVVKGALDESKKERLEKGIFLNGVRTARCKIKILQKTIKKTHLAISLYEGRKRQIREIFATADCPVLRLKRTGFGPLELGGLRIGSCRHLTKSEINKLKSKIC